MAEIDNLIEIMKKRRSIRKFKPDPIPDKYVEKLIEAAILAPSGANTQPWEFIVVKDQKTKEEIANIFIEYYRRASEVDKEFVFGQEEPLRKKYTIPPVLLIVCSDPRCKEAYLNVCDKDEILHVSMGAAMEHIHLAATALGLAFAWGTVDELANERVKQLLEVPKDLRVMEVFSLGYPDMEPPPRYYRNLKDMIHNEKFDQSKWRKDQELKDLISSFRDQRR
jgi:nitroreductase